MTLSKTNSRQPVNTNNERPQTISKRAKETKSCSGKNGLCCLKYDNSKKMWRDSLIIILKTPYCIGTIIIIIMISSSSSSSSNITSTINITINININIDINCVSMV